MLRQEEGLECVYIFFLDENRDLFPFKRNEFLSLRVLGKDLKIRCNESASRLKKVVVYPLLYCEDKFFVERNDAT